MTTPGPIPHTRRCAGPDRRHGVSRPDLPCCVVVFILTTLGVLACSGSTEVPIDVPSPTYTIELSRDSMTLVAPPGEPRSVVVTATVRTINGGVVSPAAVVWSTDSPGVATVNQTGTVTAVGEGITLLRARFGGSAASAVIRVVSSPTAITFTATGSMATTRLFHTATLLADGKVLIVGGMDRGDGNGRAIATVELYDPATGTFARMGDLTKARSGHSATLLPNGKVLIAGGTDGIAYIGTAELFDPATGTFSQTGDLRRAQVWNDATLLTTGKVLISGGLGGWSACCPIPATPELYDPATGVFTTTGTYAGVDLVHETYALIGLTGTKATLLHDGRVLLTAEPAAQLYDPVTGTFSRTGAMLTGGAPQYISGQTATLLGDGRVLLTGGHHEDIGRFRTAELYDPATGRFAATDSMASVRDGHTATLLPNGTVLVTGGESVSGCSVLSLGSAEIYDPSNRRFFPAGRMNVRREWHTATLLKNGRVLVTGGLTFDGGLCGNVSAVYLASAELYGPSN